MTTLELLMLAEMHVRNGAAMQSSALVCYEDAKRAAAVGDYALAKASAVRSLRYSVGVFHADYAKASA